MSTVVPGMRIDPYKAFNFLITLTKSAKQLNFGGYAPPPPVPRPPRPPHVVRVTARVSLGSSRGSAGPPHPPPPAPPAGGFSECTGLEIGLDAEEYKEGGNNGKSLRFPSRVKWTNIKLKRGLALSDDLWLWHYGFVEGTVARRDGVVTLLDEQLNPVKVWAFKRGLPVRWTGPSLNAMQSQVAIEELEIAHEGLVLM
jgi:phage tail-like protein